MSPSIKNQTGEVYAPKIKSPTGRCLNCSPLFPPPYTSAQLCAGESKLRPNTRIIWGRLRPILFLGEKIPNGFSWPNVFVRELFARKGNVVHFLVLLGRFVVFPKGKIFVEFCSSRFVVSLKARQSTICFCWLVCNADVIDTEFEACPDYRMSLRSHGELTWSFIIK